MIGWRIEVAYVHLVGDGDDITLSTNFTGAGSNKVHVYKCYSDVPAGTWEVYVCCHDNKSICMDNPAAIGRATIDDIILYYTTTLSGNMYTALPYMALPYTALQYTLLQNTQHLQVP